MGDSLKVLYRLLVYAYTGAARGIPPAILYGDRLGFRMRYKSGLKVRYQEDVLIACLATDKARNIGFDRPKPLNTFATFGTLNAGARLDAY